jgi:hypothetical protein
MYSTLSFRMAATLAVTLSLTACGGGSSSGNDASTPPLPVSMGTLVPAPTMTWRTAGERTLTLSVSDRAGGVAPGAAVRVFTASRFNLEDGSVLDEPVPVALLDTVVADSEGRARLDLQWPGHVEEILLVATWGDQQARAPLHRDNAGAVTLNLAP